MADSPLHGAALLLLEDEPLLRKRLARFLESEGVEVAAAASLAEARRLLSTFPCDFALLDVNLPDGSGLDLLRENLFSPTTPVVVMTAEGGIARAVEAMRLGAADFLSKPFEPEELPLVFQRARQARSTRRLQQHQVAPADAPAGPEPLFFGASLDPLRATLHRILAIDARLTQRLPPIIIEGETGTGKSSLARWIHLQGPRAAAPLVEINASALPETLAESELFGHERGAFTDARAARLGLFEAADGGTLFLDEIPSLSLPTQAKILTALDSGVIRRLGGNKPIRVDVRLIAATNRHLETEVAAGRFREDLFHRLNLLRLTLPPLRERASDIPALAAFLLQGLARKYRQPAPELSPPLHAALQRPPRPRHNRELSHELERAFILGSFPALLTSPHSPLPPAPPPASAPPPADLPASDFLAPGFRFPPSGFDLEDAILRLIRLALDQADGNVSQAARLLGVSRDYIRYRLAASK